MFPWSDTCLFHRLRKQRRLSEKETEILDTWNAEVCSGGDLPEVEIISLLNEQIPKYKLRADSLTQFSGYENQDWFIPALKPEEGNLEPLSPDQIRETLNYFLLCSNRVSQMTKTYNDIEAVTRLLEEKEKDIELTARIGKELLGNNQKLENTVATLESELKVANEKITQLSHELFKKTELIQILTNDVEDNGSEAGTPTGTINFDILQNKIGKLEEENIALRNEASFLAAQTDEVEEQEQKLVIDFGTQVTILKTELLTVTDEADKYRDESRIYKQLSQNLADKLTQSEEKLSTFRERNEELSNLLEITRENQNELAIELADLKDKYAEVLGLLQETQEALKKQNRKSLPTAHGGGIYPSLHSTSYLGPSNRDSLGTELECSLFSELSLDSGISSDRVPHYRKVFETVRSVSGNSSLGSKADSCNLSSVDGSGAYHLAQPEFQNDSLTSSFYSQNSSGTSNKICAATTYASSSSQRYSWSTTDDYYSSSDSESSDEYAYPARHREGIPGAPGSADLAEALRRLTPAAVYARRAALSSGTFNTAHCLPSECRTPDSIMSTSSFAGAYGSMPWKLPSTKLQIVKPLEGSQTLHHWSQLATPSLNGLLEDRPGIKTRGGVELEDLGLRMYTLTDVEEDEVIHPGKSFQPSGSIYTYTNSTVMHPDDGTSVTSSICGSRMSTVSNSRASTAPGTPSRSRRDSTCTFSVTLGLAKLLNERGIKAATPSTLVTPSYTPTATPCNSPEGGSPYHSRSVSPSNVPLSNAFAFPGYLMSSGAEYLRKTLSGSIVENQTSSTHRSRSRSTKRGNAVAAENSSSSTTSSQLDKKRLTGIRLMETVEKIGVQALISTTFDPTNTTTTSCSNVFAAGTSVGRSNNSKNSSNRNDDNNNNNNNYLGVPGRPGSGVLEQRINQLPPSSTTSSSIRANRNVKGTTGRMRPDLGTVSAPPPAVVASLAVTKEQSSASAVTSTLGTLSSMLFGRKGGLL